MTARAAPASAPGRSIVIDIDLPHRPAKVWRALTEPALLAQWLMPNDIRPVVGHRFTFDARPVTGWRATVFACEVLAVDPGHLLRYTWRGGSPDPDGAGGTIDTVVTWTLVSIDTGTRLRLVHDGFPVDGIAFDATRGGWSRLVTGCLAGLLSRDPTI